MAIKTSKETSFIDNVLATIKSGVKKADLWVESKTVSVITGTLDLALDYFVDTYSKKESVGGTITDLKRAGAYTAFVAAIESAKRAVAVVDALSDMDYKRQQ